MAGTPPAQIVTLWIQRKNSFPDLGIQMIEHPRNREGWSRLPNKLAHMLLIEQYRLAVCVEYHRNRPGSPYSDLRSNTCSIPKVILLIPPAPLETGSPI